MEPLHFTGHCYVLLQGNWCHPQAPDMRNGGMIWYPERTKSFFEQVGYRPYVISVVTECPWVIGLYDSEKVFAVDKYGEWARPRMQTYCASVNWIMEHLMEYKSSSAAYPLDSGRELKKIVREYTKRIDKANKIFKKRLDVSKQIN